MKKSTLFTTIAFAFMVLLSTNVNAQKFVDLDKSPLDISSSKDKTVKVVYSRPQLKGRDLAKLAPNGKVWRTGANEGTEITFSNNMTLGGTSVKAGTYTMTSIPGEKEWTIILNSKLGTWGGNAGKDGKSTEVARFNGTASTGNDAIEAFSIAFDGEGNMHFGWGTTRVAIPLK